MICLTGRYYVEGHPVRRHLCPDGKVGLTALLEPRFDLFELLGPVPAEGQPPEAEMVAKERQALLSEKSQINVLIGDAETASLRVNRLIDQIVRKSESVWWRTNRRVSMCR